MTSHVRVPQAEISGVYGAVLKRFSRKMLGTVPGSLGVMWNNRPVLRFSLGLGQKAARWHQCDENLKSLAHMAVASLVGCSFCLDLGYFMAHNQGLDVAKAPPGCWSSSGLRCWWNSPPGLPCRTSTPGRTSPWGSERRDWRPR